MSSASQQRRQRRLNFLAQHPGLEDDLQLAPKRWTLYSLQVQFMRRCELSDAQVALAHKVAEEVRGPSPPVSEKPRAQPPSGRATVTGTILGLKDVETDFGLTPKMLVEVEGPDGSAFRAFGTVPSSIFGASLIRGRRVSFKATFAPSEDGFAFFTRPTQAVLVGELEYTQQEKEQL
jgi:hypothetical protein